MLCTHLTEVTRKVESSNLPIVRAELLRVICNRCDRIETCPSLSQKFDDFGDEEAGAQGRK